MRIPSVLLLAALAASLLASPARADWPIDTAIGGVPVCSLPAVSAGQAAVTDGAGGVWVAWNDLRTTASAYLQHLDANGVPRLAANGVLVAASTGPPAALADGAGGVIVVYVVAGGLFAQHHDALATPTWGAGVAIGTNTNTFKQHVTMAADGSGGALIAWSEYKVVNGGPGQITAHAQRVDHTGTVRWGSAGLALATTAGSQTEASVCSDGAAGGIISWTEARSGNHIYTQRVDSSGVVKWAANGTLVSSVRSSGGSVNVGDGAGGAIIAWHDNGDIYAQRITSTGSALWGFVGVTVCNAANAQADVVIDSDGAGGGVLAWTDPRGADVDIYAQHLNSAGAAAWAPNGTPVCTSLGDQLVPQIVSDGGAGAIVSWSGIRDGAEGFSAQHVIAGGSLVAPAAGLAVFTGFANNHLATSLVATGTGSAIVVWRDERAGVGFDLYAQRIDGLGQLGDPSARITSVRDVLNDQGGHVKVSWHASNLDVAPQAAIGHYIVQHWTGSSWFLVADVIAQQLSDYSVIVGTNADSTGPATPYDRFRVKTVAATFALTNFWYSPADSGHSVDNLAPLPPAAFTGHYVNGTAHLAWAASPERDLAGYRLYRGEDAGFTPGPANRMLATTALQGTDDAGEAYAYKLTAVDLHGNESEAVTWMPSEWGAGRAAPSVVALLAPAPDPARSATMLAFALPLPAHATLAVCDVSGRQLRTLADADLVAGRHEFAWDLRDSRGARVHPGLYFARLTSGRETRTRKLVVVP